MHSHKKARLSAGITQEQIATEYGCHVISVKRWEKKRPEDLPVRLLDTYSRLTGKTLDELLGRPAPCPHPVPHPRKRKGA